MVRGLLPILGLVACTGGTGGDPSTSSPLASDTSVDDTASVVGTGDTALTEVEERFDGSRAVDILFIVDNSGSMSDDQAKLASGFGPAILAILASGVDWHVGVITTDTDDRTHSGRLVASPNGDRWLDADTPFVDEAFAVLVTVGDTGSGDERGLEALQLALVDHADGINAGFRREEAALHTVVLSDEDDASRGVVLDDLAAWYEALAPEPEDAVFHAVVGTDATGPFGALNYGGRYIALAEATGGSVADIARVDEADYSLLDDVLLPPPLAQLPLAQLPVPGSVTVEVARASGVVESLTEGVQFEVVASTSEAVVHLDGVVTQKGDEVVVRYRVP